MPHSTENPFAERGRCLTRALSTLLDTTEIDLPGVICGVFLQDLNRSIWAPAHAASLLTGEAVPDTLKPSGFAERISTPITGGTFRVFAQGDVHGHAAYLRRVAELAEAAIDRYRRSCRTAELEAAIRLTAGVLAIVDQKGKVRTPGCVLLTDLGYGIEHAPAHVAEVVEPEMRPSLAFSPPLPHALETRLRHRSGTWLPYVLFFKALPGSSSVLLTAQPGSIVDSASGEQRYQELFEHATDMLFTHDLSGRITTFNQTAERLTGCSRVTAVNRNIRDMVATEHQAILAAALQKLLGGEAVSKYRIDILDESGKRCPMEVSSRLIFRNGRPVGVQSAARDQRERMRLESQLLHAQKMEAIGRLAGGVAHDFNNLLTVIAGYTQWILDELPTGHPLCEPARESLLATDRARRLTNQLLAFSRMQVVQPEIVDLNMVVARIERMLRRVIGEDVELQISMSPQAGAVRADPGQIEQVLLNLCVNSRDALPRGGTITLETENVSVNARTATQIGVPTGEYVCLRVADNGTGMSEEVRAHIFEPFFTTKETGKGTGLGLSMVYGIIRQSEGYITVDSAPNEGTTFCIFLPREAHLPEPTGRSLDEETATGSETILLVEDEASVRRMVREMLLRLGYSVIEAPDGKMAFEILQNRDDHVDILLTDVVMPEMGGRELVRSARLLRPDLRVLYISGYTNDAITPDGPLDSGELLLKKPFTPQVLARKIREVLDRPAIT